MFKKYIDQECKIIAQDFFYKMNLEPNFDIFKLFNKLDIEVLGEKLPMNWEYAFHNNDGKIIIYYNKDLFNLDNYNNKKDLEYLKRSLRYNLTLALADLLLVYKLNDENLVTIIHNNKVYSKGRTNYSSVYRDYEINSFAANLLMPEELLIEKFYKIYYDNNNCVKWNDILEIGYSFGVNPHAITTRCRKLGLII